MLTAIALVTLCLRLFCFDSPAGNATTATAAQSCGACTSGRFASTTGKLVCDACPGKLEHFFTDARTVRSHVFPVTHIPFVSSLHIVVLIASCVSVGTFSSGTGAQVCTPCPE